MREILFKAKSLETGKWIEGYYVYYSESILKDNLHMIVWGKNFQEWDEIDPETVCQYTGMTDKNGKKVFEGDILEYDEEHWNVLYLEEDAMFGIESDGIFEHFGNVSSFLCEVIGNIHDEEEKK